VTGWLLDTNILSELRRPRPERKVLAFIAAQPLELLYVSTVTFAEIRFGIEVLADAGRRAELNDWLAHKVRPMFEQRVLAVTEDIMFKWRLLVEDGRKAGHTFSQPDLIIAATALHHGLTVVSRDVGDYRKARAPVLNPWREQAGSRRRKCNLAPWSVPSDKKGRMSARSIEFAINVTSASVSRQTSEGKTCSRVR
jgi:predicted nucleic acid-binding protein